MTAKHLIILRRFFMWKTYKVIYLLACLLILSFLTGCIGSVQNEGAANAIETYLEALVTRDFNRMVNSSCAAWEAQAKVEFDSFAAVRLELDDLACKETGQENSTKLISCDGSIIANYGAEDLEINIADRTYLTVQEGGEWRMCGYK
jgi:hypothetical protein